MNPSHHYEDNTVLDGLGESTFSLIILSFIRLDHKSDVRTNVLARVRGACCDVSLLIDLIGCYKYCGLDVFSGTRQSRTKTAWKRESMGLLVINEVVHVHGHTLLIKGPMLS